MEDSVLSRKRQRTGTGPSDDLDKESPKPEPHSPTKSSLGDKRAVWAPFGEPLCNKMRFIVGPERISIVADYWALEHISPFLRNIIHKALDERQVAENDEQYVELCVPEEKPETVMIFLGLVYATRLPQYENITPSQLLDLALLADKWVCVDRLFYGVEYYLSRLRSFSAPKGLWQAYAASYILTKSNYFQAYSNRLTSSYQGSYLPFIKLIPDLALGARLCLALEEKRSTGRSFNGVSDVLCLGCFDKAKDSFLPNRDCSSCSGSLATLPQALLIQQKLPAATNTPSAEKLAYGFPTSTELSKFTGFNPEASAFSSTFRTMVPGRAGEGSKGGLRLVGCASSSTSTQPQSEKAVTQFGNGKKEP